MVTRYQAYSQRIPDAMAFPTRQTCVRATRRRLAARVPSANRISLLRDADGDGIAEVRTALLSNLNSPFGMALVGDSLYIANTDAVVRVPYAPGDTRSSTERPIRVLGPAGGPPKPSLDEEHHRQPGRVEAVHRDRIEQQRRRTRHRGREGPRGGVGVGSAHRQPPNLCDGPAQSCRHGLGACKRRLVGRRQRT